MLPKLSLPEYSFNLHRKGEKLFIFDPVRKKHVRLTPEEWVRQHWIMHLHEEYHMPISHMAVEQNLRLNNMSKRADIIVYNRILQPALLVECKAPGVTLSNSVFEQASRYNLIFKVPWLLISNGNVHYAAFVDQAGRKTELVHALPGYDEL
ncbi:MAG: type I restriction enzyme HsdR N-terminal domain-containing protein [Bacteroidales bacterium]